MSISIERIDSASDLYSSFNVHFYDVTIFTLVTHDPDRVTEWLSDIQYFNGGKFIVGLDVEWRPNNRMYQNPVATLQLCVGTRCLIYQLIHSSHIPESLIDFMSNHDHTFVGVSVGGDLEKLKGDYGFGGDAKCVDLRVLAADQYRSRELNGKGLKELTRVVLGRDMQKPKRVTMSRWDWRWLTDKQVQYACIDAFVSFEIGRVLNALDI